MTPSAAVAFVPSFKKASALDATALFATAAVMPLLVHLLPSWGAAPIGAHLLPMFWVTFIAAYLYGAGVGSFTGLASPLANLLFIALPAWDKIAMLGFELVVFAVVSSWLVRRAPRCWLLAPLACIATVITGAGLQWMLAPTAALQSPVRLLTLALAISFPGLLLLTAINLALVKRFPKR